VDGVGFDFMEAVFDCAPGQVCVAKNASHTLVCVVRVKSETDPKTLREQFVQSLFQDRPPDIAPGLPLEVFYLARRDNQTLVFDWYEAFEAEMGVQWKRKARPAIRYDR